MKKMLTPDQRVAIAAAAHEANRHWCLLFGDGSQVHWEDAEDWQCASAIDGVACAVAGATPEELHESWMKLKLAQGWVYGPAKDPEARTHPCLVPYQDLPAAQRAKDTLFAGVVLSMVTALSEAGELLGEFGSASPSPVRLPGD